MKAPSPPHSLPNRAEAIQEFLSQAGWAGANRRKLAGDASFRHYDRVEGSKGVAVLMDAPPEKEDVRPFLQVARYLHARGDSAPAILAADEEQGLILLEDLGDALYSRVINAGGDEEALYEAAVALLVEWYKAGCTLKLRTYDTDLLLQEASLFSDWYMPQVMGKEKAAALRQEYLELWSDILKDAPLEMQHFVHRDYHADNLLWLPARNASAKVGLLDFQDAVLGDAAYDLASLLEDARRDVNPDLAAAMKDYFIRHTGIDKNRFEHAYAVLAAQRNSKIIGIFTRLAVRDGKSHYLPLLPRVWAHLQHDLSHPALAKLAAWTERHILPEWRGVITVK